MKQRTRFVILLVLLAFYASLGCVRRRLTIRTNPPNATVYVDKQYVGNSPTATSITYYGTREIEVVRDGYRTEKILRTFHPPWYQIPPLDFLAETFWPREIRDERIVDITLVPQQMMSSEQLQSRANNLRLQAAQGIATPVPPAISPSIPSSSMPPGNPSYPSGPAETVGQPPIAVYPPPVGSGRQVPWTPGQYLRDFLFPGGSPPTRIPEAGILPGGGYRPEM